MRIFAFILSLGMLLKAPAVLAEGEMPLPEPAPARAPVPPSPPAKASPFGKPSFISDGQRISVKEGGLSIKPPLGWEVFSKLDSLTLLMQVPHQPGMRYQRTIQVASFSEPRFIDEMTAKEYEKIIVEKFSSVSSAIEAYRIRNHMTVDLADGRTALLFYTEFKLEGVDLMQAHILVSSATRHYLMTFTDIAEHFESDAASQFLAEAWDSLISTELPTPTPQRFQAFAAAGVGVVALAVLGFLLVAFRAWRSGRNYHMYADGRGLDDESEMSDAPRSKSKGLSIVDPQTLAGSDHDSEEASEAEESFTNEDIAI